VQFALRCQSDEVDQGVRPEDLLTPQQAIACFRDRAGIGAHGEPLRLTHLPHQATPELIHRESRDDHVHRGQNCIDLDEVFEAHALSLTRV